MQWYKCHLAAKSECVSLGVPSQPQGLPPLPHTTTALPDPFVTAGCADERSPTPDKKTRLRAWQTQGRSLLHYLQLAVRRCGTLITAMTPGDAAADETPACSPIAASAIGRLLAGNTPSTYSCYSVLCHRRDQWDSMLPFNSGR